MNEVMRLLFPELAALEDATEPLSTSSQRFIIYDALEAIATGKPPRVLRAYAVIIAQWATVERVYAGKYRKEAEDWKPRADLAEMCHAKARMWALVARFIRNEARIEELRRARRKVTSV